MSLATRWPSPEGASREHARSSRPSLTEAGRGGGPGTAVRVTPSRPRADEWAVVLAAAGIPHWLRRRLDGWALIVPAEDVGTAMESLAAYDRENAAEAAERPRATPAWPPTIAGVVVALLLVGFFAVSRPGARGSWFMAGNADSARMFAGEWWRAVTALTLHADAAHLAGNAVGAALLFTAVCRQLGPGVGLCLLLLAGVVGNAVTAVVHGAGHVSVGASTAIFGGLGILAALRLIRPERAVARRGKWWVIVASTLVLAVLLGAGPRADLYAHLFGLVAGAGLGALVAALRRSPPAAVQWLLMAAAAAAVAVAWRAAL
jgi:rhomboid protease GluP